MSRETKVDRLVRTMFDNVSEHVHELKALAANPSIKETDVERFVQSFFRSCLGYTASNGFVIRAQEKKGRHRPDLIIMKGDKPILVCEIKKLGFDLQKSEFRSGKVQLKEYLHQIDGVRWGILSNGYEMLLLDFQDATKSGLVVLSFDFRNFSEQGIDVAKKIAEEMCYDLADFHENAYTAKSWEQLALEATAFSPESLARAILSNDCLKVIAKIIRGNHDYKADTEVLTDRIHDLVVHGLDEAVLDWNDVKHAELSKYIKSQKRASRKIRRRVSDEVTAISASSLDEAVRAITVESTETKNSA